MTKFMKYFILLVICTQRVSYVFNKLDMKTDTKITIEKRKHFYHVTNDMSRWHIPNNFWLLNTNRLVPIAFVSMSQVGLQCRPIFRNASKYK